MGIHDRQYMSGEGKAKPSMPKTFTARFVFICAIVYLLDLLSQGQISDNFIFDTFKIKQDFELWRILSSFFMFHPGTGLLFVAIILYIFYSLGHAIESELGSTKFINLLISISIGMALVALILPGDSTPFGYVDGMLSGLFLAYGLFLGKQKMTLKLYFLIPLTLSGHSLIGFTVGIIFISALVSGSSASSALPMLGGCLGAYLFITQYMKGNNIDYFNFLGKLKGKPKAKKAPPVKMNKQQQNFQLMTDEDDNEDVDQYIKDKVDPILEKIAQSGMNSLTAKEKKILDIAKKKMGK